MTTQTTTRPIVVGVDGTALSRDALVFALQEAEARQVPVHVVMAWTFGTVLHDADDHDSFESESLKVRTEVDAAIADALTRTTARATVEPVVVHGSFGEALIASSRDAAMLIVGSGHKGPLARTFLGSVSEYCVRHSAVPVVVVPSSACV